MGAARRRSADPIYTHGAEAEHANNSRSKSGNAGIEYAANQNDTIQLDYRYTDAYFLRSSFLQTSNHWILTTNQDYSDRLTRVLITYAPTDKTLIEANAGYLQRTYRNSAVGDFSGDVWRVAMQWKPTDKTQLVLAGWHELHAYLDSQSNYYVSKGGSFSPVWTASEKFTVSMLLSWENQDFIPYSDSVLVFGPRADKVASEQVNVEYTPRSAWILNVFFPSRAAGIQSGAVRIRGQPGQRQRHLQVPVMESQRSRRRSP